MAPEECIERIQNVAKKIFESIPAKNNADICPITRYPMINPVIIWPCTHRVDQLPPEAPPLTDCPTCRGKIKGIEPDRLLKEVIDTWQQEDRIPTLSHCKNENKKIADLSIQTAKACEEIGLYDDALLAYTQAFLYTKKSEAYEAIPRLYKKLDQPEKATLAYLYLALYQLEEAQAEGIQLEEGEVQEGKLKQAIETLESAMQTAPDSLKIDILLASLALNPNPSQEQIDEACRIARAQKKPQDAMAIYKQVLAVSPHQIDAATALASLLETYSDSTEDEMDPVEPPADPPPIEDQRTAARAPIFILPDTPYFTLPDTPHRFDLSNYFSAETNRRRQSISPSRASNYFSVRPRNPYWWE